RGGEDRGVDLEVAAELPEQVPVPHAAAAAGRVDRIGRDEENPGPPGRARCGSAGTLRARRGDRGSEPAAQRGARLETGRGDGETQGGGPRPGARPERLARRS